MPHSTASLVLSSPFFPPSPYLKTSAAAAANGTAFSTSILAGPARERTCNLRFITQQTSPSWTTTHIFRYYFLLPPTRANSPYPAPTGEGSASAAELQPLSCRLVSCSAVHSRETLRHAASTPPPPPPLPLLLAPIPDTATTTTTIARAIWHLRILPSNYSSIARDCHPSRASPMTCPSQQRPSHLRANRLRTRDETREHGRSLKANVSLPPPPLPPPTQPTWPTAIGKYPGCCHQPGRVRMATAKRASMVSASGCHMPCTASAQVHV